MLSKNILAVLALALSASALPWNTPYYPSPTSGGITTIAPTSTSTSSIPNRTGAGGGGRDGSTSTSPAGVHPTGIVSSGNDGEGNQDVGNSGQNAINGAANSGTVNGDVTVEQATTTCGNAQLNCCNKVSKKGDTTNAGLLGALFGSGDLGVQCTPINLPIIGIQIPINKACDAKAACCQGNTVQNGLVNVGCIALASLL